MTTTFADCVQEMSATVGTDPFVLSGVVAGGAFRTFGSKFAAGDKLRYHAEKGAQWEVGIGTLVDATHISRDVILSSSNNDQIVTFLDGTMAISEVLSAYDIMRFAGLENDIVNTATAASVNLFIDDGSSKPKRISATNFINLFGSSASQLTAAAALSNTDILMVTQGTSTVRTTLGDLKTFLGAVGGTTDTTPPSVSSAQVTNASPNIIVITFSENLSGSAPAASAFTVSGGKTVSSVAMSGTTVSLTVSANYVNGDVITVSYTQPGTNNLQDAAGNLTASFTNHSVTNNVGIVDTTAPTASSAVVSNSTPTVVAITMSEAMSTSAVPAASAFTVSGHTVSSVAISGNTINLTVSSAFAYGEAAQTVSYTQPGTSNAQDLAGNLLANFAGLAITNNVSSSQTMASMYLLTSTNSATSSFPAATMSGTSPNEYASTTVRVNIRSALTTSATYPNNADVKFVWGKQGNPCPTTFNASGLPANSGNGNDTATNSTAIGTASHLGSWSDSSSGYFGTFTTVSSLNAWGTPGTYVLWIMYSDGSSKMYDNNTGTPLTWILS